MPERTAPTLDEVLAYLHERRNWGRWGADDQRGAINLITPGKRVQAAGLVRSGRIVSLSRDFPKRPGPNNPQPAQHFVQYGALREGGGGAVDYYGIMYHGYQTPTSTRSATSGTTRACGAVATLRPRSGRRARSGAVWRTGATASSLAACCWIS